jgi:hypothetical protein
MANTFKLITKEALVSDQASISFTSIGSTYTDLMVLISARLASTSDNYANMKMVINSSSTSYTNLVLAGTGSATDNVYSAALNGFGYWYAPNANATANTFTNTSIYIPNYGASQNKSIDITGVTENNATSANAHMLAGLWSNTSAVTSLTFSSYSGSDLKSGTSIYLYGIKNS